MSRRALAAALLAVALAVAGWFGWRALHRPPPTDTVAQAVPDDIAPGPETVETVAPDQPAIVTAGTTPMRERVTVLGLLNKRNGHARELTLRPGQFIRIGDVAIHLRACDKIAPWEPDQLTGAFVQIDARGPDGRWRRPFSGWLFKERPNLNVVQHPVYDVWTKSCTMSFPATGPATETLRAASSPKKSAPPAAPIDDAAEDDVTPASAPPSDAR